MEDSTINTKYFVTVPASGPTVSAQDSRPRAPDSESKVPLCTACQDVLGGKAERDPREPDDSNFYVAHHRSLKSFAVAVGFGCAFCCPLFTQLCFWNASFDAQYRERLRCEGVDEKARSPTTIRIGPSSLVLKWREDGRDLAKPLISWAIRPAHELRYERMGQWRLTDDAAADALLLARHWFKQCHTHPKCDQIYRQRSRRNFVPTRLLEISRAGEAPRFRLIDTNQTGEVLQYVALSYCWGTFDAIKLKHDNVVDLHKGFDDVVTPLTFQHAFAVCRFLGVRYMWIDSLCIIQDDTQDWGRESKRMSDIYRHALISIAASASDNSNGSLFRQPALRDKIPFRHWLSPATYGLYESMEYNLLDDQRVTDCLEIQPLNSRGWVLQERILACRILHFTNQGLIWECGSQYDSEAYQHGLPKEYTTRFAPSDLRGFLPKANDSPENRQQRFEQNWADLVLTYTRSNLTFPDDRPAATLGISKEVERLSGMQYICGLWGEYLHSQLLWSERPGPKRQSKNRRMPSFSWLSVSGVVLMDRYSSGRTPLQEIVDVQVGELEATPTGVVQRGIITLHAVLREVRLVIVQSTDGPSEEEWHVDGHNDRLGIEPDWSRPGLPDGNNLAPRYFVLFLMELAPPPLFPIYMHGLLLVRTTTE